MKKKVSLDTADRELKAHVYQQIALLEPQLGGGAQVFVILREDEGDPQNGVRPYVVDLRIQADGETFQVSAIERTPYLAMNLARAHMQAVLAEVQTLGDRGAARQSIIQSIIENVTVH